VKVAEETTTAVHSAVAVPLHKIVGMAGGILGSVKSFLVARRKGY
jgi:hypothetical protein